MFIAEKGQGAYHNNRRMRVAARRTLSESMVACGIPPLARVKDHESFKRELAAGMARIGNIRRLGAAAIDLAMVASGRFDGYWERGINSWDVAAGVVLMREAGGFVTDLGGGADMLAKGEICAGNEAIHRLLLDLMRKA
jgi:myo-inositol-1(or 4)-monophosphatase